ncbi:hypothetical protein [Peptostreptococcus sp.]
MKKMVSLLLAFVIGFQTLIVSEAYSVNNNQNVGIESGYTIENVVSKNTSNEVQLRSVPKYISKVAIRRIIKNTTAITNVVGKRFGREAAIKVGNVIYNIKPALRALERLDKVTYGRLYDAILGATGSKTITGMIMFAIEIVAPL